MASSHAPTSALRGQLTQLPPASIALFALLLAAAFGATLPDHPVTAVALLAVVPLVVAAPTLALYALLFITVLVPYASQNRLSIGGGAGRPGLLVVDVLVALGVLRMAVLVATRRRRLDTPVLVAGGLLVAFAAETLHGIAAGAARSDAGFEARALILGTAAFILAWPLVHDAAKRRQLEWALLALGLALGLWGLAQWIFHVHYSSASGDVGVRPGINQIASLGGGQLQGGLFAYPVAVILAYAALLSKRVQPSWARTLVAAAFALNAICVLVTYERTVWGATVIGCLLVAATLRRGEWSRSLGWLAFAGAVVLAFLAIGAGSLTAAGGRVESLLALRSDTSVQSRAVESRAVIGEIRRHPVVGAGFGASVTWGEQGVFATTTTTYTHEGYLWLAWKIGVPLAALVVALVAIPVFRRTPRYGDPTLTVAHVACRAALVALLVECTTFPVFNTLGITAVLGMLAAVCVARVRA